jgi:hypothetical protein
MYAGDIVDAIVTAGVRHGADGHGKDGLDGRIRMLARTYPKGFGMLLERALRLKMKAKPDERDRTRGRKYLTEDEAARLRESGIPEEALQFMTPIDDSNLPAEPPETAEPNGTRDLVEAVINAAVRHGSDRHGRDGLTGYMGLLQVNEPKTFKLLTDVAQRWEATSRPDKPKKDRRSAEEAEAALRAAGEGLEAESGVGCLPELARVSNWRCAPGSFSQAARGEISGSIRHGTVRSATSRS